MNELNQKTQPRLFKSILWFVIIPIIPLSILAILAADHDILMFGGLDHFYMEIISVILSFIVAYYCIMRGYAFNDKLFLFLGLGFHAAGMIDILHGIFSVINLDQTTFTAYFIPQTWVAGRIVMGAVIMIALIRFAKHHTSKKLEEKISGKLIILYTMSLAVLAGAVTTISIFQPFPFVTIDFIIKRPYELISAGLFVVALFFFYKDKIFIINDVFYKALAVSIILDIFVSVIISYSSNVFDLAFNISHMLKISSFFILIMGLTYSGVLQYKEKDRLNERLETSEEKFRNLYENSPALHRTIDINGTILDCNDSYAKRFGYSKDEIIGSSIFKFVVNENKDALKKSFETWKKYGTVYNREVWFKTKRGETFPALISANNIYDRENKLIGSNTIIREITDFYKAKKEKDEKNLAQSKIAELRKIEKMKDEFISIVSHELLTPLVPIKGSCNLLLGKKGLESLDDESTYLVKIISKNIERLESLIRRILLVQRLEMHKMKWDMQVLSTKKVLDEVLNFNSFLMEEKKISFTYFLKEDFTIFGDQKIIHEVFDNLIQNAVDFVPKKNGRIEIGITQEDHKGVFYVKDNGVGISKEKQTNLFDMFYQVDSSDTRPHGGIGIGLGICKKLVEGMAGKIWCESESGKGSTFYFSVPLAVEKIKS